MATLITPAFGKEPHLKVSAFRMYPDSEGIIRLRVRGESKSVVNIHLSPAEADKLAEALTRTRS